jgi:antitoxin (DNA-binding transcriptional repressor) of toxin-antitoxin stability system
MKKATLEKVQARFAQYVEASAKQPVLIIRDEEPVAMLVGVRRKKKQTPIKLRDVLKRAWKDYEEHGAVSHELFWDDLAKEISRQWFAAAFHLSKLLALGNDSAETLIRRGDAYAWQARWDLALADYLVAARRAPNDPAAMGRSSMDVGMVFHLFDPRLGSF